MEFVRSHQASNHELVAKLEDYAEKFVKHGKHLFPTIARICLVSTFLEDGIRMWFQWSEQREYMDASWGCGYFLASLFVFFNLVGQIGGSLVVLFRFRIKEAVYLLTFIVVLQTVAYQILWDLHFFLRNVALAGALILLYAEAYDDQTKSKKSIFAGVPSLGENKPVSWMQLAGRILVGLMFVTIIFARLEREFHFFSFIEIVVGSALLIMVFVGYKTKLSALVLVIWLMILNIWLNCWWTYPSTKPIRDFLKYDFFQTMSVVGGLLMVVSHGPGDIALDKKQW